MIRLKYFLMLILLIPGCKDKDIDGNSHSVQDNNQDEVSNIDSNELETIGYSDVNGIDRVLAYSIPNNAQERKGPPASDGTAIDYVVDDQLIGRKTLYPSGNDASIRLFKNGKPHGPHRGWYENGQLRFEMFYNDGIQCHWSRFWHDNGQLKSEVFIKDGLQHGTYRQWGKNGKLLGEFEFTMGNGEAFDWHLNGNIKSHVRMVNGRPHGIWKQWDEDGNLLEDLTRFFLNGKEVEKTAYYEAKKTDHSLVDFDEYEK